MENEILNLAWNAKGIFINLNPQDKLATSVTFRKVAALKLLNTLKVKIVNV